MPNMQHNQLNGYRPDIVVRLDHIHWAPAAKERMKNTSNDMDDKPENWTIKARNREDWNKYIVLEVEIQVRKWNFGKASQKIKSKH